MKSRLLEVFGMLLVGDGALTLVDPKRHCLLWEIGPEPCRELADEFVRHPAMSRVAGLAELALGIWLSERQKPGIMDWLRRA